MDEGEELFIVPEIMYRLHGRGTAKVALSIHFREVRMKPRRWQVVREKSKMEYQLPDELWAAIFSWLDVAWGRCSWCVGSSLISRAPIRYGIDIVWTPNSSTGTFAQHRRKLNIITNHCFTDYEHSMI